MGFARTIGPDQEGPRPGPPRTSRRDSFVSQRERPSEVGFGKWNARSSFVLVCFRLRCWAKVTCIHFRGPALHGSTSCGYLRYYVFRGAVLSVHVLKLCAVSRQLNFPHLLGQPRISSRRPVDSIHKIFSRRGAVKPRVPPKSERDHPGCHACLRSRVPMLGGSDSEASRVARLECPACSVRPPAKKRRRRAR